MNEPIGTPMPEAPKKNNTVLIIVIALVGRLAREQPFFTLELWR